MSSATLQERATTDEDLLYSTELLCEKCGKYYENTQVKRCIKCGVLLCSACRRTHTCKKQEPIQSSSISKPFELTNLPKQTTPIVTKTEYDLFEKTDCPELPEIIDNDQYIPLDESIPHTHYQQNFSLDISEERDYIPPVIEMKKPLISETKQHAENEMYCEGCGRLFMKTDLRRCHKCGVVLCPICRKHHKCSKKKR